MQYLIVTRHPGAVEWLRNLGIEGETVAHVETLPETPHIIVGVLPLHLAVSALQEGHRVVVIQFTGPPPRGGEYTAAEMDAAGAYLAEFGLELSPDGGTWSPQRSGVPAATWGDMQHFRIGLWPYSAADEADATDHTGGAYTAVDV